MPKVVALQYPAGKLAGLLTEKGYKVIGLHDATRLRAHVDAILYNSHRPDTIMDPLGGLEAAVINPGLHGAAGESTPSAIILNITGLHPDQVAAQLEYRLQHRNWRT